MKRADWFSFFDKGPEVAAGSKLTFHDNGVLNCSKSLPYFWPETFRTKARQLLKGKHIPLDMYRFVLPGRVKGNITLEDFLDYTRGVYYPKEFREYMASRGFHLPDNCFYDKSLNKVIQNVGTVQWVETVAKEDYKNFYFRRLHRTKFMSSTWDALVFFFKLYKFPRYRTLARLKKYLFFDPEGTAQRIKSWAGSIRGHVFAGQELYPCILNSWLKTLSDKQMLQVSFITRSLPAPLNLDENALTEYYKKMSTPLEFPEDLKGPFEVFVNTWLKKTFYAEIESVVIQPSTSGCLEYNRSQGGHFNAYLHLHRYYRCRRMLGLESEFDFLVDNYDKENDTEFAWGLSREVIAASAIILNQIPVAPAMALLAPEKGLKLRIPTKSITPVAVIGGLLRSLMQEHMEADRRIAPSVTRGDPFRLKIDKPRGYMWRSQDLTTATDNHTFWMTTLIYNKLLDFHPKFAWIRPLICKLCGPKGMYESISDFPNFGEFVTEFKEPEWLEKDQNLSRDLFLNSGFSTTRIIREDRFESYTGFEPNFPPHYAYLYIKQVENWYQNPGELKIITKRGQLMGDPTSWPGLPLVTLFCYENVTPSNRRMKIMTCGDDARMAMTTQQSNRHTNLLNLLGSYVSPSKDYLSERYSLFMEEIFDETEQIGLTSVSSLIGPPGGSKGEANWYNAADSFNKEATAARLSKKQISKYICASKFTQEWEVALRVGIPLSLPQFAGGIGMPARKYSKLPFFLRGKIATYLSTLTLKELLIGRSLNLVPHVKVECFHSGISSELAFNMLEPFINTENGIPYEDVSGILEAGFSTLSFLMGVKPAIPNHVPNIFLSGKRLERRLAKVSYHPSTLKFIKDFEEKRSRKVDISLSDLTNNFGNPFGIVEKNNYMRVKVKVVEPLLDPNFGFKTI